MRLTGNFIGFLVLATNVCAFSGELARYNAGFNPGEVKKIETHEVRFIDHLPEKSLSVCLDVKGEPMAVFRKVVTEVCSKGECLPVFLKLYWGITGKYLGFGMEQGEVLTKFDHEEFDKDDYDRLHELLNDRLSLLAAISEDDIAGKTPEAKEGKVDIVTGATKKEIIPYTVNGAAYTTYTLWHLVYGASQDSIAGVLDFYLTPSLLSRYLRRPDAEGKIWAVLSIKPAFVRDSELKKELIPVYRLGTDFMREVILDRVLQTGVDSASWNDLIPGFFSYSRLHQKRKILEKLDKEPAMSLRAWGEIAALLSEADPLTILSAIRVMSKHKPNDVEVVRGVKNLANHRDDRVGRAAADYLESVSKKE